FENIHGTGGGDLETRRARPAGRDRWSRLSKAIGTNGRPLVFFISGAVQGLGQNARRGGLPHAARPREDVAVRHAVVEDGVLQGLGDQPLADHPLEALRPILAGNVLIRHGAISRRSSADKGSTGGNDDFETRNWKFETRRPRCRIPNFDFPTSIFQKGPDFGLICGTRRGSLPLLP